eukprot:6214053-Pleurochrysis_carterae.AAC.7
MEVDKILTQAIALNFEGRKLHTTSVQILSKFIKTLRNAISGRVSRMMFASIVDLYAMQPVQSMCVDFAETAGWETTQL